MKKTILCLGLNDKDAKRQIIKTADAVELTANVLTKYVDGATIYHAKGIYTHDDGTQIIENTLRIELFQPFDDSVLKACQELKTALNQESIAMDETESNTNFI